MKRDIQINISQIKAVENKINIFIDQLDIFQTAATSFYETIKKQDSAAYEKLSNQWEENVSEKQTELKERYQTIAEEINKYVVEIESYIEPEDEDKMMRVDRNDIWWNCTQIRDKAVGFGDILVDKGSSIVDYKQPFYYHCLETEEQNNARKSVLQAKENEERARRERNYQKLQGFRNQLVKECEGHDDGSIGKSIEGIQKIYDNNVTKFENEDDKAYGALVKRYLEWASIKDYYIDKKKIEEKFSWGIFNGLKDVVVGLAELMMTASKLCAWAEIQNGTRSEFGMTAEEMEIMPEDLDEEVTAILEGYKTLWKNRSNIPELIGQTIFDTVDEEGIAYSVGYVGADIAAGILLDKGIGKLAKVGKVGKVGKAASCVDDVLDGISDVSKASKVAHDIGDNLTSYVDDAARCVDDVADIADDVAKGVKETAEQAGKAGETLVEDAGKADVAVEGVLDSALDDVAEGGVAAGETGPLDDVITGVGEGGSKADIGNKMDYLFGKATGNKHNIERSKAMQSELQRIGIHDTASGREYISNHLDDVLKDSSNISNVETRSYVAKELPGKPVVEYTATTRESLLMGPGGAVKVESVWDGNRLITVVIKGGN